MGCANDMKYKQADYATEVRSLQAPFQTTAHFPSPLLEFTSFRNFSLVVVIITTTDSGVVSLLLSSVVLHILFFGKSLRYVFSASPTAPSIAFRVFPSSSGKLAIRGSALASQRRTTAPYGFSLPQAAR